MFWFKRKTITLDFFTWREEVYNDTPVSPLRNAVPDWWKNLPKYEKNKPNNLTLKGCPGFLNTFKNGFYIPFWCDAKFEISNKDVFYKFSDNLEKVVEEHPPCQWGKFIDNNKYRHFKIMAPWLGYSKKKTQFAIVPALWNQVGINDLNSVNVCSGITDFYYNHTLATNLFLNIEKNDLFMINKRQPLSYYIPLSENNIKIKNHLISYDEFCKKITKNAICSSVTFFSFINQKYKKFNK